MTDSSQYVEELCTNSKLSKGQIPLASGEQRNHVLQTMAKLLDANRAAIAAENRRDLDAGKASGLSPAMLDRLTLTESRIDGMIQGLKDVAALPDSLDKEYDARTRPNGLIIHKTRVPIGVILMIFESRPNVTVDAAGLCLKTGNCVILRGGKEALQSNKALAKLFQKALVQCDLPGHAVQLVETPDRKVSDLLLKRDDAIDLVIPRGGEGLIRAVAEQSTIPTIKHYKGVCHVYVDEEADLEMARRIVVNAKVQRPGVCNAMETLLLHKSLPTDFIADLLKTLGKHGVELRACPATRAIHPPALPATQDDWDAEYLELKLAVRIVESLDEAIDHIARFGSSHTEAIVTGNEEHAKAFLARVDASSVMLNASTRFGDGGEYGMGAEIGISTDKLHARGPMALDELTTYKWIVRGTGQIRE